MSDETAEQIEFLIEAVVESSELTSRHLDDITTWEEILAESLQDISVTVAAIHQDMVEFFKLENDRFEEKMFRDKEALREALARGDRSPLAPVDRPGEAPAGAPAGAGFMGGVGSVLAGSAIARVIGTTARRIPQVAGLLLIADAALEFASVFDEARERLTAQGVDPDELDTEVFRESLSEASGRVYQNLSKFAFEPLAGIIADEVGMSPEERTDFVQSVKDFKQNIIAGTGSLFDDISEFFGEETSLAAGRETEERVAELGQELREAQDRIREAGLDASPGGEIETGLARLQEIETEREEMRELPFTRNRSELRERNQRIEALADERDELEERLAPVLEERRIQTEIQQVQEMGVLSQQGYAADDVQPLVTETQATFAEIPAAQKEQFFEDNIDPKVSEAIESGALEKRTFIDFLNYGAAGAVGTPVVIKDLEALKNLSAPQLEALLVNDDRLGTFSQLGALSTSDRMVVEAIYRGKVQGDSITTDSTTTNVQSTSLQTATNIDPTSSQTTNSEVISSSVSYNTTSVSPDQLQPTPSFTSLPVSEASREVAAAQTSPNITVVNSPKGGDSVNTTVNNMNTTVMGGGAPARSGYLPHHRLMDTQQSVV